MPEPNYINIEYFFYKAFIYAQEVYFFVMNLHWSSIYFWAKIVSVAITVLFIIGIIYNLVGIARARKKETEEF